MLSLIDILQLQLGSSTPDYSVIRCDVIENEKEFLVLADASGVQSSDIKINIDPDQRVLHLTFSRPSWPQTDSALGPAQDDQVKFLHSEMSGANQLHRTIRLPKPSMLNLDAVKSWSKDGIVTISIPRVVTAELTQERRSVQI
jgi:HSP20 family molecular chaperone IbpA